MNIKKFSLSNVGRFRHIAPYLAPTDTVSSNITVFIGNNGAGKTSILKSIATGLSWLVARVRSEKGIGNAIPEQVIRDGQASAEVSISIVADQHDARLPTYNWMLSKASKGRKVSTASDLSGATQLADFYRNSFTHNEQASLPLIAFYPVERVVLDVPLKIRERHSFLQLDGYDNALNNGVDFRRFFEWFREREDTENEAGVSPEVLAAITKAMGQDAVLLEKLSSLAASSKDKQLSAVRTAIEAFMPGFTNLRVRRRPRLHMSIDKNGQTLNVLQLSQGEKSLMALVGDIARRLAMMNPALDNPLNGDGIVLIDEVDMHLHPTWQRKIIKQLTNTFPCCQFILTTHSPLVISECKDVLVYSLDDGQVTEVRSQFGEDANSVLLNVMNTSARNEDIEKEINDIFDLIQDATDSEKVLNTQEKIDNLSRKLSHDHLEVIKASLMFQKRILKNAKN